MSPRPAGDGGAPGPGQPSAVVFDADGVLVDTGAAWRAARAALFERHGRHFGSAEAREALGTGVAGTGKVLAELLERPERTGELTGELAALLADAVASDPPHPLPGALELLEALSRGLPVAVASNAPRPVLLRTLEAAGLDGFFDPRLVIGAEDAARPKPAPDLYLEAVRLLRVEPAGTVAVEDSPAGIASARAAGLNVIGVRSAADVELDADEVVDSLADKRLHELLWLPSAPEQLVHREREAG